jgi:heme/copper-type cytochrome/quinol oxidase subunit 1
MYLSFGMFSAILGTVLASFIRAVLSKPEHPILSGNSQLYNTVVTMHGLIMIFFFVMPTLIGGFGNIIIPVQAGAPDMAFPRLNNFSF